MESLPSSHPNVKKNLMLIRGVLGLVLTSFVVFAFQTPNHNTLWLSCAEGAILLSYLPFLRMTEEQWCKVLPQYLVFSMDLILILGTLFVTNHMGTEFLLSFFLTLFIAALSRSVAHSLLVALAVTSLHIYRVYLTQTNVDYYDPILLLSLSLLFMVAIEASYLAYRVVEEEEELVDMVRRMDTLHQQIKEGNQTALEYAGGLKNVLDSLPFGAIAVSRQGDIIFINQTVGRLLGINNPRSLQNMSLQNPKLGLLGAHLAQSLKNKMPLVREYLDIVWAGQPRRFRLDSSEGVVPGAGAWGTLFLIQESFKPIQDEPPTNE